MRKPIKRYIIVNGNRFIEVENCMRTYNGAIPVCAGRECHFHRRGECWIREFTGDTEECHWPYFWREVDSEGNVLDRDGWKIGIRIDSEGYMLNKNGDRYTYGSLYPTKRKRKCDDEFVKY